MRLILLSFFKSCLLFACLLMASAGIYAAPDIELEGLDGKKHNINKYIGKGKWTVLNIWGAKCPPCREEMPDLVQFHDERHNKDAIVVGIAIDFPSYAYAKKDEVKAFADDFFIDFPILLSDGNITQKLDLGPLEGLPTTYMYNPEGEVVGAQVGGITKKLLEDFIKKKMANKNKQK